MNRDSFFIQPGQTWVMLGDSITEDPVGYCSICERQVGQWFPQDNIQIVNSGISGNKARDMLARFERDVLRHHPQWCSISVGVNDVWHGFYDFDLGRPLSQYDETRGESLEEYRNDLRAMLSRLNESNIRGILVSPTMIGEVPDTRENEMLSSYIREMKDLANEFGALYCPMNESMWRAIDNGRRLRADFKMTIDGVHMTKIGAYAMAACLLSSIGFPVADALNK